jgi:hypothetical protein
VVSRTDGDDLHFWDPATGDPKGAVAFLNNGQFLVVSPTGHYVGSPAIEKELVYIAQTDGGQETLTPEEFSKNYRWKNDPSQVDLRNTSPAGSN